jgi:hypothetical protein
MTHVIREYRPADPRERRPGISDRVRHMSDSWQYGITHRWHYKPDSKQFRLSNYHRPPHGPQIGHCPRPWAVAALTNKACHCRDHQSLQLQVSPRLLGAVRVTDIMGIRKDEVMALPRYPLATLRLHKAPPSQASTSGVWCHSGRQGQANTTNTTHFDLECLASLWQPVCVVLLRRRRTAHEEVARPQPNHSRAQQHSRSKHGAGGGNQCMHDAAIIWLSGHGTGHEGHA